MSARLSLLARAVPICLLTLLSACGLEKNEFQPVCPRPSMVQSLSDLTRYRTGTGGQDLTDLALTARLVSLNGSCEPGADKTKLNVTVAIRMEVQRGPALSGRQAVVPVFLAVTEGEMIRDKQVFPVTVNFPPNVDTVTLTSPGIDVTLPVDPSKSGAAYGLIAGFQLTADELAANRHRLGR